ncbi:MAG: type II toxin-antitoxin system RelE/ParE family toxin [Chloroflexi bacterium]|nr:type II toxin-antitoxin system RelE/ParE family toxin [Chloroflexota bacterium]MBI3732136.1 type II toxin-antitoxin system RelE/ParE family toxin [Chloroflexota bacterium]
MTAYEVLIEFEVHHARKRLPGSVRQQIRRLFDDLASNPRPSHSQAIDIAQWEVPPGVEVRRLRLVPWRIIYAVNDQEAWVWILAIRRRPPYNYEDLPDLIARIQR